MFGVLMRAALGALLLTVTACTTTTPGTPVPDSRTTTEAPGSVGVGPPEGGAEGERIAPGVVATGQGAVIAAYRAARAVDPCALHDPAAAAVVTGQEPDQVMPGADLSSCDLALTPPESLGLATWDLTARVGADWNDDSARQATPVRVGDLTFFEVEPYRPDDRSCTMALPHGAGTALELTVRRLSPGPQPKVPCEVARGYLTEVADVWAAPALRVDGVTSPALSIAEVDPCVGLSAAAALMSNPRAAMAEPHTCGLTATESDNGLGERVRVKLAVETDPRPLTHGRHAAEYRAITVDGRPAVRHQPPATAAGAACSVTVVVDPDTVIRADLARPSAPVSVQVISAIAPSCELATAAAEGVTARLR